MKRCFILLLLMSVCTQLRAQQWTAVAPMHYARAEAEAVQLHDGTILVVGGYANGAVEGTCEIYDPKTDTWSLTGSLSTPRFRFALNILPSGKVVALGGLTNLGNGTTSSCEVYDPTTGTWSTFGNLPEASENFPTCYLDDSTLVFLGGLDANTVRYLATSGEINPNSLALSAIPPMLIGTYSDFGEYLSSRRMIVDGGGDLGGVGGPYLRSTEVFDLNTGQWSLVDSLVTVCADGNHHIVKLSDDRLVIPSGRSGPNTETSEVQVFDPVTLTWSNQGNLPRTHFHCYSILVGEDSILTIGGATDPATTQNIVSYTDWYNCRDGTSWEGPSMIDPRHVYAALNLLLPVPESPCVDSEAIYVFGGETTGRIDINRCERLILGVQQTSTSGPTTLTLPAAAQSILASSCNLVDTFVRVGVVGCDASDGRLDSAWIAGSHAFRISDTRSAPRALGVSDSVIIQYSPSANGHDTAQLVLRYDLGSGFRDTSITIFGSFSSALLSTPVEQHRGVGVSYFGIRDSLPLGVDINPSVNLDSIWPYLHDISGTYSFDSSVVRYYAYLPPSGWIANAVMNRGDAVDFSIHNISSKSPSRPLDLGSAEFLPVSNLLATSDVLLSNFVIDIGSQTIAPCISYGEDQDWSVKVLVAEGVDPSPNLLLESEEISMYPNPAGDELFVRNANAESVSITLYDEIGRAVLSASANASSATGIDISSLPAGEYMAVCHELRGTVVKRIIKN